MTTYSLTTRATKGSALTHTEMDANLTYFNNSKVVSVKDYGAVGDGVTDDTTAIETAIAAAANKSLFFPAGTYKITRDITSSTVDIFGEDFTLGSGTIIRPSSAVTTAVTLNGGNLRNIVIDGTNTSGKTGLIAGSTLSSYFSMSNVTVQNFGGASGLGFKLRQTVALTIKNCSFSSNARNVLVTSEAGDGTPTTGWFYNCGFRTSTIDEGVKVIGGYNINFLDCVFEGNTKEGLKVIPDASANAVEINLKWCWFEGNYGSTTTEYQYVCDGSAASATARPNIEDCFFNGTSGTARAMKFTGSGVRASVSSPIVPNVSAEIVTASSAQVDFPRWSIGVTFATVVDFSGADVTAALSGAIKFPVTQYAYTDPNTLDDYEEGTFTPTLTLGSGSVTYTTQRGVYTKIGRAVHIEALITINVATAPSGTLSIAGLPFTSSSGQKGAATIMADTEMFVGAVDPSATTIRVYNYSGGALANPGAVLTNGYTISVSATYSV